MSVDKSLAQVVALLCKATGSTFSDQVLADLKADNVGSLVSYEINPADYSDPHHYFLDACIRALTVKVPFSDSPFDRVIAAKENFWKGERSCTLTNARFSSFNENWFPDVEPSTIEFLERARRWIKHVLGPLPKRLEPRFGPGATFGDRGRLTTVPDKITASPSVTSAASCLLPFIWETAWGRCMLERRQLPSYVRGNRFTTVPKDAKKDRGICIEPSINVALQLSVGSVLKQRLSIAGLPLVDLQDTHRQWARSASRMGDYATIDLSNASDTISTQLVKYLLPCEWFETLYSLRSPFTLLEGKWVRLEKFSSMGNGYTFELETLIFASLCASHGLTAGQNFSVFGDDIIVPSEKASSLIGLLEFCGFSINKEKSFTSGPFRESCGGDFFSGVDVRPYFLKKEPSTPSEWISLANGLYRNALRLDMSIEDSPFFVPWKRVLDQLPSRLRQLRGPCWLGDLVINHSSYTPMRSHGMAYVYGWKPIAKVLPWHHWTGEVVYASILYGAGETKGITPRGSVSGFKISRCWLGL